MADVTMGREMVFKVEDAERILGLRISPVGMVEEKQEKEIA